MLYRILRSLVRMALQVYFRRIYVLDVEKLPLDKPVLIACNHPNSFLEAVILACFLPRPLHFLVRGDVFKNPRYRWFFRGTNQVPIYRFRDGFANLRNNQQTFEFCHKSLSEGKAILIFAEGGTEMVRRLRPLKKGLARIAMGAMDFDPSMDLRVVPVGVNFSNPTMFRSDVIVKLGEEMDVTTYYEGYKKDGQATVSRITEDLAGKLLPCVIHIEEHLNEQKVNPLFTILRSMDRGFKGPFSQKDPRVFEQERSLATALGEMSPRFFQYLMEKVDTLERLMPRMHFRRPVSFMHRSGWGIALLAALLYPVYLFSILFWGVPFGITQVIARSKVKANEFYGPVRLSLGLLLGLFWWGITWVVCGLLLPYGWYWGGFAPVLMLGLRIYLRDLFLIRAPGISMQLMAPNRRKKVRNQFDQILVDVNKLANKQHIGEHLSKD